MDAKRNIVTGLISIHIIDVTDKINCKQYYIQIYVHIHAIQIQSKISFFTVAMKVLDLFNLYPVVTANKVLYKL